MRQTFSRTAELFVTLMLVAYVSAFHVAKASLKAKDQTKDPATEQATDQAPASKKMASQESTAKDRTDLAVTVYNSNVALVRDVRQVTLPSGGFALKFEDVAASINPATVHFRSLGEPAKLTVLEQNYEYDLLDPAKLLQKYVGKEITLTRYETENNSTKVVETKAILLADNNSPVWKIGDQIVTGMMVDSYRFPDLPQDLYSHPTLIWSLENEGSRSQHVEASHLTDNMNWNADYVLTVNRDEKSADLDGWVTLINGSGAAYENAKLQLVAGAVHRLPRNFAGVVGGAVSEAKAAPQMVQENFSEYHLYTLQRRTTIADKESKQISLLNASGVNVDKLFLIEGEPYYYRHAQSLGSPTPQPIQVDYRFKNSLQSHLGMPLPAGTIRAYQADSKGGIQLIGEDSINHTAKDEDVTLHVGDAFDVVCERKETDYNKVDNRTYEMEFEIALRNHKDSDITVEVREPVGGDWQVVKSNFPSNKLDANTISFQVPVPKDGNATLDYRVQVRW
jgi:hypothetical protein